MIIPALIAIVITPIYLLSRDVTVIIAGFALQGLFGLGMYGQNPAYLAERFPTEVRATASAFFYHLGSFVAGFTPLVLTLIASDYGVGFNISMMIGTVFGAANVVFALLCGPETKGKPSTQRLFCHKTTHQRGFVVCPERGPHPRHRVAFPFGLSKQRESPIMP